MIKKIVSILVLVITLFAEESYMGSYSKGTTSFIATKNEHGVVLRSSGEQFRWTGMGVNTGVEAIEGADLLQPVVLYLGKSCDAYSPVYGKGTWGWSNGGFMVTFKDEHFGFGRQELSIDTDEEYGCSI